MKTKKIVIIMAVAILCLMVGCSKNKKKGTESSSQQVKTTASTSTTASTTETETSETTSSETVTSEATTQQTNENNQAAATEASKSVANRTYSYEEKQAIENQFTQWAGKRAAIGGMALNNRYFDHGAGGIGDWYAVTTSGEYILVQRESVPTSSDMYTTEALGGVVFYTSKFGTLGYSNEIEDSSNNPSTATGYTGVANLEKPITKYMLGSNGVVYEYQSSGSFSDGFYEVDDQGRFNTGQAYFYKSGDVAAQNELQRILANYN